MEIIYSDDDQIDQKWLGLIILTAFTLKFYTVAFFFSYRLHVYVLKWLR